MFLEISVFLADYYSKCSYRPHYIYKDIESLIWNSILMSFFFSQEMFVYFIAVFQYLCIYKENNLFSYVSYMILHVPVYG